MSCNYIKSLENKTTTKLRNVSYLFTPISYLEKTYTTTAREPSIYPECFTQSVTSFKDLQVILKIAGNKISEPDFSDKLGIAEFDKSCILDKRNDW